MRRAAEERGGADGAELLEAHVVDAVEHRLAQIGTEARDDLRAEVRAAQHRAEAYERDDQHTSTAAEYVREIGKVDALVEYVAHNGGQEQFAQRGRRAQQHRQQELRPVRLQKRNDFLHIFFYVLLVSDPVRKNARKMMLPGNVHKNMQGKLRTEPPGFGIFIQLSCELDAHLGDSFLL